MKKIYLLTTLLLPIMAWSELNEYQTDIYFANGIMTSEPDAIENSLILERTIKDTIYEENITEFNKY